MKHAFFFLFFASLKCRGKSHMVCIFLVTKMWHFVLQGVSCDYIDEFWYVTDLSIGPLHENSLSCSQNPKFRPQIFELSHLKTLSFFNCFTSLHDPITLPGDRWEKLAASLESLEFRSNPSLIGPIPTGFGNFQTVSYTHLTLPTKRIV